MSETSERRVRARAVFRSELPLRVLPSRAEEEGLHTTALMLAPRSEREKHEIVDELRRVATRYQNSVRQRANAVAKPNIGPTLRSIAKQSKDLSLSLNAPTVRSRIDAVLQALIVRPSEIGVDAIHAAAEVFEHVGDVLDANASHGEEDALAQADLRRTAAQAAALARMLLNLPMSCEWELVLLQQYEPMMPEPSVPADGAELLRELTLRVAKLALAASQLISQRRGPAPNTAQMIAVLELKSLFERQIGSPATHSAKSGRWYAGCPKSPFGLFAAEAFKIMELNKHRRRGLSDAITFAVWPSRASAKAASILVQRAERDRAARQALLNASLQTSRPPPHP